MSGIGSIFGKNAGATGFYRRVLHDASQSGSYNFLQDERYQDVIDEVLAGRDIKAAQVYCEKLSAPIQEGQAAVTEIRFLINEG